MKEVKLFRTVTGGDIIATLVEEDEFSYTVDKPLLINPVQDGTNLQLAMSPIHHPMIGTFEGQVGNDLPEGVELGRGSIMFVYNPAPELLENYSKMTGTIQIAHGIPGKV